MSAPIGLAVSLRVRIGAADAYQPSGVADPARLLGLLNDVATELMIRLDGDEGMLRGMERLELLAPVFVGDFIEVTGVLTKVTPTTRQVALEARKLITYARSPSLAVTAADALASPPVVCRALATCSVPRAQQRRPRLVLPALPPLGQAPGRLPEGNVLVTPPPDIIVTPPRDTPPEVMLAASIVGAGVTRDHTPHVPVTAEEIAAEARRCRDAGACIVHLGMGPDDTVPQVAEVVAAIRAATDVLVVVSPIQPGPFDAARRLACAEAGADFVAMATGSFNYADAIVETPRASIRTTAQALRDRSARGFAECHELSHLDEAVAIAKEGLLGRRPGLCFVFGVPGAIGAAEETIRFVASRMPRSVAWFFAGVGRHQRRVTELAIKLGGNARAGLADNIYLRKGVLAESSAQLVDRMATYARNVGRDPASPQRARVLLGLVSDVPVSEVDVEVVDGGGGGGAMGDVPTASAPGDEPGSLPVS